MMPPEEDPLRPPAPGEPGEPEPGASEPGGSERWLDKNAGPMVRPYVMTSGRTEPSRGEFDLITLVVAVAAEPNAMIGLGPEHLAIVRLCRHVMSVAEITGHLDLPVATVRVMLGDLLDRGLVSLREPATSDQHDIRLYKAVIDGLRAL
ncbi:MAG: DUF742 domain-containing protein [Spirillospora sp.]